MKSRFEAYGNFTAFVVGISLLVLLTEATVSKKSFYIEIGVPAELEQSDFLKEKGYAYIEGDISSLLLPQKSEEEFKISLAQMKASSLPVKIGKRFIPGHLKCVGPEAVHDEILAFAEIVFRRANEAGIEYIILASAESRSIPEGYSKENAREQFISLCKALGPLARKFNIQVVVEPLNSGVVNFINTVKEGGEIVREVNDPGIGLLVDIYHMLMEGEGPESIRAFGDLIMHAHIAEKEGRSPPGTYNEDFTAYIHALKRISYEGGMSLECEWKNLEAQAGPAYQAIQQQIESAP